MFLPRVISYGQIKVARLAAVCLACFTLALMVRLFSHGHLSRHNIYEDTEGRTSPWRDWRNTTPAARSDEVVFLSHLAQKHSLTNEIPWFARRFQLAVSGHANRPSMTEIGKNFLGRANFARVRVNDENLRLGVESAIKLPVGRSSS